MKHETKISWGVNNRSNIKFEYYILAGMIRSNRLIHGTKSNEAKKKDSGEKEM